MTRKDGYAQHFVVVSFNFAKPKNELIFLPILSFVLNKHDLLLVGIFLSSFSEKNSDETH